LKWHVLKLQSRFARRLGQSLHAPVIQVTAPVEYDLLHALGLRPLGDQLADRLRPRHVAAGLESRRLLDRRSRNQRVPLAVVDHLGVDVGYAPKDSEARTLLASLDLLPDARMNAPANVVFRNLLDHLPFAPAPVLPAFLRSASPVKRTPLFLYGSGLRSARMFAATCPIICLSCPVSTRCVCL